MEQLHRVLPPFVVKTAGIREIFQAILPELAELEREARCAGQRFSVQTADSTGLRLWETELGLEHPEMLSPAARRVLVELALEQMQTCTPARLRSFLNRMLEGQVTLTEQIQQYQVLLEMRIEDFYVPRLRTVREALRRAVPAHLNCELEVSAELRSEERAHRVFGTGIRMEIHTAEEENR